MTDAVVTGIGTVTPAGGDVAETWAALLRGRSVIATWPDLLAEGLPVGVAARVADDRLADPARRGRDLAAVAAGEALAQAGLSHPGTAGVFVGTTMGESAVFEQSAETGVFDLAEGGGDAIASDLAARLGLSGPVRTYGTACAAGNYAIGAAAGAVEAGAADVVLAGGVEPFSRLALLGFARMRAVDPGGCRPFGAGRRGMTLGEAAAFLVVEHADHARARGATVLARIGGLGLAADAHHPTAPDPAGVGMAAAMSAGLARAGVEAGEVGWVSAHGTGTPLSDAAEALALHRVFGAQPPPVSSVKGVLGHSLGAATAVEAVVAVCALRDRLLPPNGGVDEVDPALELDVVGEPRPVDDLGWVLSCGYAFGGLDSALLVGSA